MTFTITIKSDIPMGSNMIKGVPLTELSNKLTSIIKAMEVFDCKTFHLAVEPE